MRIVVITGGSRGIGRSAAQHCARAGMGVVVTFQHRQDAAADLVGEIVSEGGSAVALRLDVGDCSAFPAFRARLEQILSEHWDARRIDALVNNAGHGLFHPIDSVSEAEFDGLMRVHLKGPFFLTQTLLPLLADGGQILNLTSATTRVATAGVAPYAAFKGGLEVLTRYMAKEFGVRGIRANAIAPGAIRTELGGGLPAPFEALLASQTALGRIGEPEDVGRVIAAMLSGANGWINAQTIEVAGGYVI
ncbi:SDR family oxidoreductase [Sphingomonas oligophenolica]|uniref:SDR family oxidoreductase n=1 Tax=Sphingomonas oligophenolica TaxID=301154 RepID=A0ABU9Y0F4_9SPHN